MLLRLRSRDGLERIEVPDGATVSDLKHAIHTTLHIQLEDLHLSRNAALLTTKRPAVCRLCTVCTYCWGLWCLG